MPPLTQTNHMRRDLVYRDPVTPGRVVLFASATGDPADGLWYTVDPLDGRMAWAGRRPWCHPTLTLAGCEELRQTYRAACAGLGVPRQWEISRTDGRGTPVRAA